MKRILSRLLFKVAGRLRAIQARQVVEAERAARLKRLREIVAMAIHDGEQAAQGTVSATKLRYHVVTVDGVRFHYGLN